MVVFKEGDILKGDEDIVCHQVNCKGVMGAGLALQIRNKYPRMYQRYKALTQKHSPDYLLGLSFIYKTKDKQIANLFGQNDYGRNNRKTDYQALESALIMTRDYAIKNKLSVAIPYRIGCGLAGGNWQIVKQMIENIFSDYPISIYKL